MFLRVSNLPRCPGLHFSMARDSSGQEADRCCKNTRVTSTVALVPEGEIGCYFENRAMSNENRPIAM